MKRKNKLEKLKLKKKILELVTSLLFVPIASIVIAGLIILIIMFISKLTALYVIDFAIYFLVIMISMVMVSVLHGLIRYNNFVKLEKLELEIRSLDKENEKVFAKDRIKEEIKDRYESLSNEHKLEVLNSIKDNMQEGLVLEQIDNIEQDDLVLSMNEFDETEEVEYVSCHSKKKINR